MAGACVLASSLTAAAVNWIPLDEEHFPDPHFIESMMKLTSLKNAMNSDQTQIDADKVTSLKLISNDLTDMTGVKNFTKLTSLDISGTPNLEFLDIRGMSSITSLKISPYGGESFQGTGNRNVSIETLMIDGTNITLLEAPRCKKLKHITAKGCTKITTVYAYECDLMGIDLSGCTGLSKIRVQDNPHMSVLRLPEKADNLTQIHACHTNLMEIDLPAGMGAKGGTRATITLNLDNTRIQRLDLNKLTKNNSITYTCQGFKFTKASFFSIPAQYFYASGTWDTTVSETVHIGQSKSFQIHDPETDVKMNGTTMKSSVSWNTKDGTFDKETGVFTFNDDVYKTTYTYNAYAGNVSKILKMTVTVTRDQYPTRIFLVYSDRNPTRDDFMSVSRSGEDRIELTHIGDNVYTASPSTILGNFHFLVQDGEGNESIVGAHCVDATAHHAEWDDVGHVKIEPDGVYSLHREQDAKKVVVNTNLTLTPSKSNPWDFTTHEDELEGKIGRYDNPVFRVTYIKDDPTNKVEFESGVTTGIENVEINNPSNDIDNPDAPVEWFNLQGMKVSGENLAPGVYVRRQGTKTEKIFVK